MPLVGVGTKWAPGGLQPGGFDPQTLGDTSSQNARLAGAVLSAAATKR